MSPLQSNVKGHQPDKIVMKNFIFCINMTAIKGLDKIVAPCNTIKQLNNRINILWQCFFYFLNLNIIITVGTQIMFTSQIADLTNEKYSRSNNKHCFPPTCCTHMLIQPWVFSHILKSYNVDKGITYKHHNIMKSKFGQREVFGKIDASIVNLLK